MFPTTWKDRAAMTACYALTGLLAYMVTHKVETARFLIGVFS
jgi:hypothetical protein